MNELAILTEFNPYPSPLRFFRFCVQDLTSKALQNVAMTLSSLIEVGKVAHYAVVPLAFLLRYE